VTRLIIDENLNKRLASTLQRRGRDAVSVSELLYRGMKDPELILAIANDHPLAVLVTGDDNMPAAHADILRSTGIAVATVDPVRPLEFTQEQWAWEVVERWAHRMAEQKPGTWRRYGLAVREWKPPKRVRRPRAPNP
jgi:hypothetical protein